jgi:hypothetical protein
MARNRLDRPAPRRGLLGVAAFTTLVACLVGPTGSAQAASVTLVKDDCAPGVSQSTSSLTSVRLTCDGGGNQPFGVRWQ